jgi:hypothetical protein
MVASESNRPCSLPLRTRSHWCVSLTASMSCHNLCVHGHTGVFLSQHRCHATTSAYTVTLVCFSHSNATHSRPLRTRSHWCVSLTASMSCHTPTTSACTVTLVCFSHSIDVMPHTHYLCVHGHHTDRFLVASQHFVCFLMSRVCLVAAFCSAYPHSHALMPAVSARVFSLTCSLAHCHHRPLPTCTSQSFSPGAPPPPPGPRPMCEAAPNTDVSGGKRISTCDQKAGSCLKPGTAADCCCAATAHHHTPLLGTAARPLPIT